MNKIALTKKTIVASTTLDTEKILNSIKSILAKNNIFTLSTLNDETKTPYPSTAFFVYDEELSLYFWTDQNARHSKNIVKNSNVAVNIFDSTQEWGSLLQGIQLRGTARVVNKKELFIGGALYLKRFPSVSAYVKKILDFHSKKFQSRLYKIEPTWIKIFDEKTFGKEEWRELTIQRAITERRT